MLSSTKTHIQVLTCNYYYPAIKYNFIKSPNKDFTVNIHMTGMFTQPVFGLGTKKWPGSFHISKPKVIRKWGYQTIGTRPYGAVGLSRSHKRRGAALSASGGIQQHQLQRSDGRTENHLDKPLPQYFVPINWLNDLVRCQAY